MNLYVDENVVALWIKCRFAYMLMCGCPDGWSADVDARPSQSLVCCIMFRAMSWVFVSWHPHFT